jgi:hypothetical protein
VTVNEVFQANFGGYESDVIINERGELDVLDKVIDRSAYILIYVKKDMIRYIFEDTNEV